MAFNLNLLQFHLFGFRNANDDDEYKMNSYSKCALNCTQNIVLSLRSSTVWTAAAVERQKNAQWIRRSGSLWTCTKYLLNELSVLGFDDDDDDRSILLFFVCVSTLRVFITIQQFLLHILLVKQGIQIRITDLLLGRRRRLVDIASDVQ